MHGPRWSVSPHGTRSRSVRRVRPSGLPLSLLPLTRLPPPPLTRSRRHKDTTTSSHTMPGSASTDSDSGSAVSPALNDALCFSALPARTGRGRVELIVLDKSGSHL